MLGSVIEPFTLDRPGSHHRFHNILMSAWRHGWWVTAQTARLTHPTSIMKPFM